MRSWVAVLIGAVLLVDPGICRAQDSNRPVRRMGSVSTEVMNPSTSTTSLDDPLQLKRLVDKLQPIKEHVAEDDKLRMVSGIVGLGVLAYEAHPQSSLPLGFIGAEALRIGLRPQLKMLKS